MLDHGQMEFLVDEMTKLHKSGELSQFTDATDITYETVYKLLVTNPMMLCRISNWVYQGYMDIDSILGKDTSSPNADRTRCKTAYEIMNLIYAEIERIEQRKQGDI